MQTFSHLQRNFVNKTYLTYTVWAVAAIVYGSLSTLYPYIPPLFGLLLSMAYFYRFKYFIGFVLLYCLIFEADRSYFLFSSWIFAFLFLIFLMPTIGKLIDCKRCLAVLGVAVAYGLYYAMLSTLATLLGMQPFYFDIKPVLVYIAVESALAYTAVQ